MYRLGLQHPYSWVRYVLADGGGATLAHLGGFAGLQLAFPYLVLFAPDWPVHSWHEGVLPSYMALLATAERTEEAIAMQSKEFWAAELAQAGIPAPESVAILENGKVEELSPGVGADEDLILKPTRGWMGQGVRRTSLARLAELELPGRWIAQRRVVTRNGLVETTRVVTMMDGARSVLLAALQVTESRAGAVTSNRGRVRLADLTAEQKARVAQLQTLHAERFALVPAISWDLMEGAAGPVVLEGNAPGAICWGTDLCGGILSEAEQLFRRFYAEHCA